MGLCILLVMQTWLWPLPRCIGGKEVHLLPQQLCYLSPASCFPGASAHVESGGNQQTSCEKSLADPLDFYT